MAELTAAKIQKGIEEYLPPEPPKNTEPGPAERAALHELERTQADPGYRRAVAAAVRTTPDAAAEERLANAEEGLRKATNYVERHLARQELAAARMPFSDHAVAAAYAAKLEAQGDLAAARGLVQEVLKGGPRKNNVPLFMGANERLQFAEQRAKAAEAYFAAAYADRYAAELEAKADLPDPRFAPNWTKADADAYDLLQNEATAARSVARDYAATARVQQEVLQDLIDQQFDTKYSLATLLENEIQAGPPSSATEIEREFAKRDPVSAALFRAAGIELDPSDPHREIPERLALREDPFTSGWKILIARENATPGEQRTIRALRNVAAEARIKYTKAAVKEHIGKGDIGGAIKTLNINLNATATPDERAHLFDEASKDDVTGERYFDQAFFEKQIGAVVAKQSPVGESVPEKLGGWLLDVTKNSPPEVANPILDAVKAQYDPSWVEPPYFGWSLSPRFFSGLSQAADAADRPLFSEPAGKRADEIADWLTEDPTKFSLIATANERPDRAVRSAIFTGAGGTLSLLLAERIDNDALKQDPARKYQWTPGFRDEVINYIRSLAQKEWLRRAKAEFAEFKKDPNGIAQPYLDDVRAHASDFRKTLSAGPELRNFIGTVLRYKVRNPAAFQPGARLQDGYGGKELKLISKVERQIIADNGGNGTVTVSAIPLLYAAEDAGVQPTAIFAVERKDRSRSFVGDRGATYTDWQDFLENNLFSPDGEFHLVPEMLRPDEKPPAQSMTSAHIVTGWERGKKIGDGVLGTAMMAGGGFLLFTGVGTPEGAVLVAEGAVTTGLLWNSYRSIERLINRGEHGRTLSVFDREARAEWLTLLGSAAGSTAMIGRFARYLPNSRVTRGTMAFGDWVAPKATMAGSLTIADAGTNLLNSDLSHDEVVSELWRMGLGTTFLYAGRVPSASGTLSAGRTWGEKSAENIKSILTDFRQGFTVPFRQALRVTKWSAAVTVGANTVGLGIFGGYYFGQWESRMKGSVGPQNAFDELAKLRADPDAYLEQNYENLVLGVIRGIPLKNVDGHLRRMNNPDGSQYYYRRVPEDMFDALKAANRLRAQGQPPKTQAGSSVNPNSDKVFVNEMWKDDAGNPMPIWVEIRPPYRGEPFRDAIDVSGIKWAKDSEPGSFSLRGSYRLGPQDGLTMNVGFEGTWKYSYDAETQNTVRLALGTRDQGTEFGYRQQDTTTSRAVRANVNFIDINPGQVEDLTAPDSWLSGKRLAIFNYRTYATYGRRNRTEFNFTSDIGKITKTSKPTSVVEDLKNFSRSAKAAFSGRRATEPISAFARERVTEFTEVSPIAMDAFKLTMPDGRAFNINTYNEFQHYSPDARAEVKWNAKAGRFERQFGVMPFGKVLIDPAFQLTYVDPKSRFVPNWGQSAGHAWEPERGPASANWGPPTIGPLMAREPVQTLDAATLMKKGVKQVAWRDLPGQGGAVWKIADHQGRRYLKAGKDVFDVTGYEEMVLSRFEHEPAAGNGPAKLSLGQIELHPLSAVKPELASTNRVSLAEGKDGVLAQANGRTYVVVDKKDVFDVTGWRQTDLQSLRYEPANKGGNARLTPIGTFTLSSIPLDSTTAKAAAQSNSRLNLRGGGEAIFVRQGDRKLVLYKGGAGAQPELYKWTGYDRRTIEEWLQTR